MKRPWHAVVAAVALVLLAVAVGACDVYGTEKQDTSGLPKWEQAAQGRSRNLERCRVPGGWIYKIQGDSQLVFVPDPPPK